MSFDNLAEIDIDSSDPRRLECATESCIGEPRPDLTAAHRLVRALVDAGVETFFGSPGGPVSPVFDAILSTSGARLLESRHETSAAFAAADYY